MRSVVLCILSGLLGAAVALSLRPAARVTATDSTAELAARLQRIEAQLLRLNLVSQRVVVTAAREPASTSVAATATDVAVPPPPEPPVPTSAQMAAARETSSVIDNALSSGAWRDVDRERWNGLLWQLDEPTRKTLMTKLIVAINRGEIHPTTSGPPL
jgi:hypothetical protein